MARIYGTNGFDTLIGGTANDTIDGGPAPDPSTDTGDDLLKGGGGDDRIRGHDGADSLHDGATGNDTLAGGLGDDKLYSSGGIDHLQGGYGYDVAYFDRSDAIAALTFVLVDAAIPAAILGDGTKLVGVEAFHIRTGSGDDRLDVHAARGDHTLLGGNGSDSLTGSDGADRLSGDDGSDALFGGDGADRLRGDDGSDTLFGDDGADRLRGGNGDDSLRAGDDASGDTLAGSAGNDTLLGGDGSDSLTGGEGSDSLNASGGLDSLAGGPGDDVYWFDAPDDIADTVSEAADGGIDEVVVAFRRVEAPFSYHMPLGVEKLTLIGAVGISIELIGNESDNTITFSERIGSPNFLPGFLDGGDGEDSLSGSRGSDTLIGDAGDDTLFGGDGDDLLQGGDGNDQYAVNAFARDNDTIIDTGGVDTVRVTLSYTLPSGIENLRLASRRSSDADGTGNEGDNSIIAFFNVANLLKGLEGDDSLTGGGGDDTLLGGLGGDLLDPGFDADVIRFDSAAEGGDLVASYAGSDDSVEISAAGFGGGLVAGMDLVATGRYAENATGTATSAAGVGQFVLDTTTGVLRWDVDGTGAAAAMDIVDITGATGWAGTEIVAVA
jgi:Ca2+-binding RTX toxin-like protein